MIVTVVHDDRDSIKYQLKILRDGLKRVTPSVSFKSCCVWEFTERVFDENSHVLVVLSKHCQSFHRKLLDSYQSYRDRCTKSKCRACVVLEVGGATIDQRFESSVGNENVSDGDFDKHYIDKNSESLLRRDIAVASKSAANAIGEKVTDQATDYAITMEEGSIGKQIKSLPVEETVVVVEDYDGIIRDNLEGIVGKNKIAAIENEDETIFDNLENFVNNGSAAANKDGDDMTVKDYESLVDKNSVVIEDGDKTIKDDSKSSVDKINDAVIANDRKMVVDDFERVKEKEHVIFVKSYDGTIQDNSAVKKGEDNDAVLEDDVKAIEENVGSVTDDEKIIFDKQCEETTHGYSVSKTGKDNNADSGSPNGKFESLSSKQHTNATKADEENIPKEFEDKVGKENVVVLEDLYQSVKWLPKVCAFLFKNNKRNNSPKCVVPNVQDNSVTAAFRAHLVESLLDLGIVISGGSDNLLPSRCCILFREGEDYDLSPDIEGISSKKWIIKRHGGTIFEYQRSCTDEFGTRRSNESRYGRASLVLFIIHLLYVLEVINITTMMGERLWRIKKPDFNCCDLFTCYNSPLKACSELDCNPTFSFERHRFVKFLVLSLFNPSLLLFFLTPFPYMVTKCCKKRLKTVCLVWLVMCSMSIYGGVSYFLWTLGNTLYFYLFLGIGCLSLCISGCLQIILLKLVKIKCCTLCDCADPDDCCIDILMCILILAFLPISIIILCVWCYKHDKEIR